MALLDLVDKLSSSIDNNEITVGILIDLAKAFDTVNHNILLSKLYHYGIRGTAYNWFKSYLSIIGVSMSTLIMLNLIHCL